MIIQIITPKIFFKFTHNETEDVPNCKIAEFIKLKLL